MPNTRSAGAWKRAEVTSVVWRTTAPARRLWKFIEAAFSGAVTTRSFAAEDLRALNVVRSSMLVRAADDTVDAITMAWRHSRFCAMHVRIAGRLTAMTARSRVRLGGMLTASASATALVGQQLTPRPEPMTWIVPALGLCIGICLAVGSSGRSRR